MYWRVTLADLRFKIVNRSEMETLRGIQVFEAVAKAASGIFGGEKKGPVKKYEPKSGDQAVAMFEQVLSGGRR